MNKIKILLTLCALLPAGLSFGQSRHYSSATLGMGGGGTAYQDGYHANFINPANLMVKNNHSGISVGLMGGVGANVGGSLMNIRAYNDYLTTGKTISGQTRADMLSAFFGAGIHNTRSAVAAVSVVPFGISVRGASQSFSLATRAVFNTGAGINKGAAELAFYGLDSDRFGSPVPVNMGGNLLSYGEISLGYARKIIHIDNLIFAKNINIYAGAAPKYLIGIEAVDFKFNSNLTVSAPSGNDLGRVVHDLNYTVNSYGTLSRLMQDFSAMHKLNSDTDIGDYLDDYTLSDFGTLARGFGLDLGITAEMDISHLYIPVINFFGKNKTLRLSMSLTDMGYINFNKNASEMRAGGTVVIDGDIGDSSFENYYDTLADSLLNNVYTNFDTQKTEGTKYSLPGMYNFGGSLTAGRLMLAVDYGFGFNRTGTNSLRSTLNLGAQYRLFGFVPLRFGTRIGGYSSAAYTAGIGLDFNFLELTVAASVVNNSGRHGSSLAAAFSGVVIRF